MEMNDENIKVFVKGDVWTPSRFYDYGLSTGSIHESLYIKRGFNFSKEDTDDYLGLTGDQRSKIKFKFIDGILQKF